MGPEAISRLLRLALPVRWVIFFLLVAPGLTDTEAYAQINSPGARTLFARNFLYRSNWRFIRLSSFDDSSSSRGERPVSEVGMIVWENFLVYGLPRSLTAIGILPLVTQSTSLNAEGGALAFRETGLADPMFLLQYDGLYRKNRPGGFTRLAGFFGAKAPWGQRPFSTGSTDLVQGVIFTHATPRWFLNGDVQWVATTEDNGMEAGDVVRFDTSFMYRLLTYPERNDLFLVLEVNAITEGKAERHRVELVDTGGDTVFLSPGVEFFLKPNLIMEVSVQIPVRQDLNGTQPGRDWVLVTGFRYVY